MNNPSYQAPRVLVIEDEPELREAMVSYLSIEGFQAGGVGTLGEARAELAHTLPDILVLDLGLPDGEGLTLLGHPTLATKGLIITSARSRIEDRLIATKLGADVYLVKPIELEELSLVIRNLYRRLQGESPRQEPSWVLNKLNWTLTAPNEKSIQLTQSEVLVLKELAKSVGHGVGRELLIHCLGHNPQYYDWRRMEALMRRLRNKCEDLLGCSLPLRSVHGVGYALTEAIRIQPATTST